MSTFLPPAHMAFKTQTRHYKHLYTIKFPDQISTPITQEY